MARTSLYRQCQERGPAWRLNNLYQVRCARTGRPLPFRENAIQAEFRAGLHDRNITVKARQIGISTETLLIMLDMCLFSPGINAAVICHTQTDATHLIRDKIMFAYERLPLSLRRAVKVDRNNAMEKRFSNDSSIRVGTSLRGGTLQVLNITEYGRICAENPEQAQEIRTGALNTLGKGTLIFVDSTAKGFSGHFNEMARDAQKLTPPLGPFDWKLHFFGWHKDPGYRLRPEERSASGGETKAESEYFAKLAAAGIELDDDQRRWYIAKSRDQRQDMLQEYPTLLEEALTPVIEGGYFEREMARAHAAGRICGVPYDPALAVHTAWDIGVCVILFFQVDGREVRFIDVHEDAGYSVDHYAKLLRRLSEERGYDYGLHLGPHDLNASNIMTGERRVDTARKAGLNFVVIPRIREKKESIAAAARLIDRSWIDTRNCSRLVDALSSKRRKWDKVAARFADVEQEGWWQHICDAYEQAARGIRLVSPSFDRAQEIQRHVGRSRILKRTATAQYRF